jgi:hypothetical protein
MNIVLNRLSRKSQLFVMNIVAESRLTFLD